MRDQRTWTMKGIVSFSENTGPYDCGANTFVGFTNVPDFIGWIKEIVADTF